MVVEVFNFRLIHVYVEIVWSIPKGSVEFLFIFSLTYILILDNFWNFICVKVLFSYVKMQKYK